MKYLYFLVVMPSSCPWTTLRSSSRAATQMLQQQQQHSFPLSSSYLSGLINWVREWEKEWPKKVQQNNNWKICCRVKEEISHYSVRSIGGRRQFFESRWILWHRRTYIVMVGSLQGSIITRIVQYRTRHTRRRGRFSHCSVGPCQSRAGWHSRTYILQESDTVS